jgi:hypothetical protein
MPRAYLHCLRRERLDRLEAMIERYAQWRQLDLLELAMTALQRQRLDPMMRKELASLLKLLINECGATLAKTKEADDE